LRATIAYEYSKGDLIYVQEILEHKDIEKQKDILDIVKLLMATKGLSLGLHETLKKQANSLRRVMIT
jgi:hypothetical protein